MHVSSVQVQRLVSRMCLDSISNGNRFGSFCHFVAQEIKVNLDLYLLGWSNVGLKCLEREFLTKIQFWTKVRQLNFGTLKIRTSNSEFFLFAHINTRLFPEHGKQNTIPLEYPLEIANQNQLIKKHPKLSHTLLYPRPKSRT